ncbi:helix-turn-helix domain-containing protein [Lachnospiraceae bacterium OttesenSCG-928-D06]|nr:helix-turn-helix domain-containing protein [Lachnospiraceae bacterium OttesenSCG-928-D06]
MFCKEERQIIESQLKLYDLDLSKKPYCVVILSEVSPGDEAEELLRGWGNSIEKIVMDGEILLLCSGKPYTEWVEILQKENEKLNKRLGREYRISVGHDVANWYDLCFSYEFARYLLENEFLFRSLPVVSPDILENSGREGRDKGFEYLATLLEIGDLEGIRESVEEYRKFCIGQWVKESEIKVQLIYNVVLLKERLFKKYNVNRELEKKVEDKLEEMISAVGFRELIELYEKLLEMMCRQIVHNDTGSIVKRVRHYMENNYKEDLKLKTIAQLFHYNSTYLGTVFKEETGETFKNVLDVIRVTHAKKMLCETSLKVYQIAEEVGYGDLDNFYMIFKKHVNISPKGYRKRKTEEKAIQGCIGTEL